MRRYLSMWKHIFDYKGKSARAEYRAPLLLTALLAALTAVFWFTGTAACSDPLMTAGFVTGVLFTAHVPPMMALTVRRLRDAGKKPWLAVLSCLAGVGTVLVMIICLFSVSSTGFLPTDNYQECVYGPPEYFGIFDPQDNVNVDVYGPPEDILSPENEDAEENGAEETEPEAYEEEGSADEN